MELLPVVCLCLLTRCGVTSADGSGPTIVTVEQDSDAVLPCSLSTKENIESKVFDWTKDAQKDDGRKDVFYYESGVHYNNGRPGQSEEFKGRVSYFPAELKHGNASIIIRNTKMADSGDYTCVFPNLQPRQKFHIKLVVDAVLKNRLDENIPGAAPKPNIRILNHTDNRALLQCEANGNPQPEVEWRDSAGNKLPAEEPQVTERDGRFYVTLNTTVNKTDSYRCVATQKSINHQIYDETTVRMNGPTPAKGEEGKDVALSCSLSSEQNIESEMFEWKKEGLKEVFFYGGIHYNGNHPGQSEEFKGRVSHFPEELKHGDASITIRNAKMSDSGIYTCDFPRLQPRQTFYIKLNVVKSDKPKSGASSHSSDQTFKTVMIGVAVGVLAKSLFL